MTGLNIYYMMAMLALAISCLAQAGFRGGTASAGDPPAAEAATMIDIHATEARLRHHLKARTVDIGERSVLAPDNPKKAASYIRDFYRGVSPIPSR